MHYNYYLFLNLSLFLMYYNYYSTLYIVNFFHKYTLS